VSILLIQDVMIAKIKMDLLAQESLALQSAGMEKS